MKHCELDPKLYWAAWIASDGKSKRLFSFHCRRIMRIPDGVRPDCDYFPFGLKRQSRNQNGGPEVLQTEGLQVLRLEPMEAHSIRALADNTNILVIKQLIHETGLSKRLRFGSCCLKWR